MNIHLASSLFIQNISMFVLSFCLYVMFSRTPSYLIPIYIRKYTVVDIYNRCITYLQTLICVNLEHQYPVLFSAHEFLPVIHSLAAHSHVLVLFVYASLPFYLFPYPCYLYLCLSVWIPYVTVLSSSFVIAAGWAIRFRFRFRLRTSLVRYEVDDVVERPDFRYVHICHSHRTKLSLVLFSIQST